MPFRGQLVFDAYGAVGDNDTKHQIFPFEGAQPFGQHPIGDIGNRAFDGGVARLSLKQCLQNGACPPAPDELDSPVKP